jgi:hypothetical protein
MNRFEEGREEDMVMRFGLSVLSNVKQEIWLNLTPERLIF